MATGEFSDQMHVLLNQQGVVYPLPSVSYKK